MSATQKKLFATQLSARLKVLLTTLAAAETQRCDDQATGFDYSPFFVALLNEVSAKKLSGKVVETMTPEEFDKPLLLELAIANVADCVADRIVVRWVATIKEKTPRAVIEPGFLGNDMLPYGSVVEFHAAVFPPRRTDGPAYAAEGSLDRLHPDIRAELNKPLLTLDQLSTLLTAHARKTGARNPFHLGRAAQDVLVESGFTFAAV